MDKKLNYIICFKDETLPNIDFTIQKNQLNIYKIPKIKIRDRWNKHTTLLFNVQPNTPYEAVDLIANLLIEKGYDKSEFTIKLDQK